MIAKKSTLIILQNILGMVFGFVTLKLVTVNLGIDEYGEMASGYAIVSLIAFIGSIGYGGSHVKRISEGQDLATCIGTFIVIRVICTAAMAATVLVSLKVYTFYYPQALTDVSMGVILATLVYFIFLLLGTIPTATFDARAETSKTQIAGMAQHPVKIAAVIFVVLTATHLARTGLDSDVAYRLTWAYYTIGGIVSFLVAWGFFFYYKYPIGRPTWAMFKSYSSFAALSSISGLLMVIILNADRVMLLHYWGITSVGQYFGVQALMNVFVVISTAVISVLLPVLSNLDSKKQTKAIGRLLVVSERHLSLLIAPITFFIFFFSRTLINLLISKDALPADFTLSFLAIVTFINALNSIRFTLMYAIGKQALAASISFVIVVLNLALNFLFIPNWSWFQPTLIIPSWLSPSAQTHVIAITNHTGAAMALIIANLIGFVLLRYFSWKYIKAGFYHGVTVKHVFASTIMILPLIYLNRVHELLRWYDLILYTLIGLGIYVLVLYLIKEFDRSDLKFYLDLMNPKGLSDYISKELKEKDLKVAMDTMSGTEKGSDKKDRPSKGSRTGRAPRRRDEEE